MKRIICSLATIGLLRAVSAAAPFAVESSTAYNSGLTVGSLTGAVTTTANTTQLVVFAGMRENNNQTMTATYNGTSMTLSTNTWGAGVSTWIFTLMSPPTATTANVVTTSNINTPGMGFVAVTLSGSTTTPVNMSGSTDNTANATSSTGTVTTIAKDFALAVFYAQDQTLTQPTLTTTGSPTQLQSSTFSSAGNGGWLTVSYTTATTTSTSLSENWTTGRRVSASIIDIVAPAPTPTPSGSPSITSVTGTISEGSVVTIAGSGFGTKPNQVTPIIWANFEQGTINPTVLGSSTSWSQVQFSSYTSVSTNCFSGAGCAQSALGWESTITNLGLTMKDLGAGATFYWEFYRWSDAMDNSTDNWKPIRAWHDNGVNNLVKPDLYMGTQIDSSQINLVEMNDGEVSSSIRHYTTNMIWPRPQWDNTEVEIRLSSGVTSKEGEQWVTQNGNIVDHFQGWQSNNISSPGWLNSVQFQMDPSNFLPTGSRHVYTDEIYLDNSACLVYVSTSSDGIGYRHVQPPSAWADGSLTITFNQSNYAAATTIYVWVRDANNNLSAAFPLTVGSTYPLPASTGQGAFFSNRYRWEGEGEYNR